MKKNTSIFPTYRNRKGFLAVGFLALILSLFTAVAFATDSRASTDKKEAKATRQGEAGNYIVVYRDRVSLSSRLRAEENRGIKVEETYRNVFKGFSADLEPEDLRRLEQDDSVLIVEPNRKITTQTRIVNGEQALPGTWSSQARINTRGRFSCGGTLIHSRWVITAAHCVRLIINPSDVEVFLGSQSRLHGTKYRVDSVHWHKGLTSYFDNDIALLRLRSPAPNPKREIARPKDREHFTGEGYIAGWGMTCYEGCSFSRMLREATVVIHSLEYCRGIYSPDYVYTANMLCAGGGPEASDSCQGDSGGPLETDTPRGRVLAGIVSWGIDCALEDYPGIYTDVSRYSNWIGSRLVGRAQAPARKRISRQGTITLSPKNVLRLPASLRFRTRGPFRVGRSSCHSVRPGWSCRVTIRALARGKHSRGKLTVLSHAGRVVARVSLHR